MENHTNTQTGGMPVVVYTTALGVYLVTREYFEHTGGYAYSVKPSVLARTSHFREAIVDENEAVRLAQAFEDKEIDSEAHGVLSPDSTRKVSGGAGTSLRGD